MAHDGKLLEALVAFVVIGVIIGVRLCYLDYLDLCRDVSIPWPVVPECSRHRSSIMSAKTLWSQILYCAFKSPQIHISVRYAEACSHVYILNRAANDLFQH